MSATRIAAIFRVPAMARPHARGRIAQLPIGAARLTLISVGRCVSPGPRRRGSRRGGGRRSLFGESGLAQAVENGSEGGQIGRVVAHRRPVGAGAGDGEVRVEREAGLDGGTRLVETPRLREGGGQPKICWRMVSVGLDRPPTPRGRLLVTPELVLRDARECHPGVSRRIARAEAQRLGNVSLRFFRTADISLTKSDKGMGDGKIWIEL